MQFSWLVKAFLDLVCHYGVKRWCLSTWIFEYFKAIEIIKYVIINVVFYVVKAQIFNSRTGHFVYLMFLNPLFFTCSQIWKKLMTFFRKKIASIVTDQLTSVFFVRKIWVGENLMENIEFYMILYKYHSTKLWFRNIKLNSFKRIVFI